MNRDLIYYPDSILKQPCDPVEDPDQWSGLISEMEELIYRHNGVGLAAPQVGESIQIFLIRLDLEERIHETYINPEIVEIRNKMTFQEGCLSFPEVEVDINRGQEVVFEARTPGGKEIQRTMNGLQAQCVQHEYDHLQGRTLVDHCDLPQKMEIDNKLKDQTATKFD